MFWLWDKTMKHNYSVKHEYWIEFREKIQFLCKNQQNCASVPPNRTKLVALNKCCINMNERENEILIIGDESWNGSRAIPIPRCCFLSSGNFENSNCKIMRANKSSSSGNNNNNRALGMLIMGGANVQLTHCRFLWRFGIWVLAAAVLLTPRAELTGLERTHRHTHARKNIGRPSLPL